MRHPILPTIAILSCAGLALFLTPGTAHAGTINQRPLYIGLSQGLIGFWPFNAKDTTGDLLIFYTNDMSGQGNKAISGTNIAPRPTIGRIGQALDFYQGDQYLKLGIAGAYGHLGTTSISMWIKPRRITQDVANHMSAMFDTKAGGVNNGWMAGLCEDGDAFGYCTGKTNAFEWLHQQVSVTQSNSITMNKWQNVTITQASGTVATIYINGVVQSLTAVNPANGIDDDSGNFLTLGDRTNLDMSYDGLIDDVRIYNRVLTPDEAKRLYKIGGTTKFGVAPVNGTLQNGLVGYWTFDGKDVFGTTAYDRSGQGNNGTLQNHALLAAGRIGQGLLLDGLTNNNITLGNPASLQITGSHTLSAWANNASGGNQDIIEKYDAGTDREYLMGITIDNVVLQYACVISGTGAADTVRYTNTTVIPNKWYHIACVYNAPSQTLDIYLNGVKDNGTLVGTVPSSVHNGADNVLIGGASVNSFWKGLIDEVRIYNRALTADEIKRLYKMGGTAKIDTAPVNGTLQNGLVGYWSFNGKDMAGVTAYDRSGNNNNGTLTNGPTRAIGRIGQALSFDGVGNYLDVGFAPQLTGASAMSVSFWEKTKDATNDNVIIGTYSDVGPHANFSVEFSRKDGIGDQTKFIWFGIRDAVPNESDWRTTNTTNAMDGHWHHVVWTFTTPNIHSLYLDGVSQSVTHSSCCGSDGSLTSIPAFEHSIFIGALHNSNSGASQLFPGSIDDVRIYNRALSPDEIKRLYNMGR